MEKKEKYSFCNLLKFNELAYSIKHKDLKTKFIQCLHSLNEFLNDNNKNMVSHQNLLPISTMRWRILRVWLFIFTKWKDWIIEVNFISSYNSKFSFEEFSKANPLVLPTIELCVLLWCQLAFWISFWTAVNGQHIPSAGLEICVNFLLSRRETQQDCKFGQPYQWKWRKVPMVSENQ